MKCPKCHFENTDTARYCSNCAAPLPSPEDIEVTETLEAPKEKLTKGSTFAGRYEIVEELGKGGMGRVYRAFDTKVEEEIALKLLKPEIADSKKTIKRFRNELKLARKITHKNVCRMFDFHEEGKKPFITMEYVKGESLKAFIQKQGMLSDEKTVHIAQQICRGLSEAHELGVVHRDLKPQNIMLDAKDNVKIMDFGIAHSLEAKGVTQTGMIIGTPDYMSPEQAEGLKADQRSDIYSLGIILYEMVTGKLPFEGDTALSVALKHKTEAPQDPREINDQVSKKLSSVILKCLEKSQEKRFQTVDELLDELRNIEEGLPLSTGIKRPPVPGFLIEGEEVEMEIPIFVAREDELNKLGRFLDQALSGKGRVVFVKGEAGSGKTALIQEFARRAQDAHPELIVAGGNCNAHTGIGDPYLPFREVLALFTGEVEARWKAGAISTDHARRLWHCLPLTAQSLVESNPELINTFVDGKELLNRVQSYMTGGSEWLRKLRELVERKASLPPDPTLQQSVLFKQYTRVTETLAGQKPVLLILDDLQWVDGGSANLLTHLVGRIQGSRVLIIGAFRPEEVALDRYGERHPLKTTINECKAMLGDIEVEVGKEESREFVDAVMDMEPNQYGSTFREAFHRHTQGHSLFTVEVLRSLKEQGALVKDAKGRWIDKEVNWQKLPTRVEAMIGERIDRMPENLKKILQLASIEGEYFTGEVLAGVQKVDERDIVQLLSGELDKRYQLVKAQGIQRIDGKRQSQYRFRHILFQKYLYNRLDKVERAHLHEEVGNILERQYGEQTEEIATHLARHFQESGIAEKAIEYLQKAGIKAIQLSANLEAVAHFRKALDLLKKFPATPERIGQELALQTPLAVALMNLRGYADREVGETFCRAHELCKQIGETPQIAPVLYGLLSFYYVGAEYKKELEGAEELIRIAQRAEEPTSLLLIGQFSKAGYFAVTGDPAKSLKQAEQAISLYEPLKHRSLIFQIGQDLKGGSLCWAFFALWLLGYPEQGRQRLQDAITFSHELAHPFTLSFSLVFATIFHQFQRDVQAVQETADDAVRLSEEHGFLGWLGFVQSFQGWALANQGLPREAVVQIRQAIAAGQATGARIFYTLRMAMLADACVKAGKIEDGLAALKEGLAFVEKTGERFYEAELHRLMGELLLMKGVNDDEAEHYYQEAVNVAQGQQAKSLELRATMSMARLWQKQGKKKDARKMLAEIYDWFTEGFDTQDLKDAKALLKELA